ncbi:hypothetical protein FK521_30255, partial [Klebsiella pneumoniae]|nr:hypothetical protein [Klebsiella pneumoniae]
RADNRAADNHHAAKQRRTAKEQRAVPIGGASLVSFKGINDAQKKAAYQFLTYLVSDFTERKKRVDAGGDA